MPVTIPFTDPFAENGLLARCTGKIIGRQRLAENRNTSLMMKHHGPVWNIFVGRYRSEEDAGSRPRTTPVTLASGRWLAPRPVRSKKIFNSPNEPACYLFVTQIAILGRSLTHMSHSGRRTARRRLAAYPTVNSPMIAVSTTNACSSAAGSPAGRSAASSPWPRRASPACGNGSAWTWPNRGPRPSSRGRGGGSGGLRHPRSGPAAGAENPAGHRPHQSRQQRRPGPGGQAAGEASVTRTERVRARTFGVCVI